MPRHRETFGSLHLLAQHPQLVQKMGILKISLESLSEIRVFFARVFLGRLSSQGLYGIALVVVVERGGHQGLSFGAGTPAAGAGDFRDQAVSVEALQ